MGGVVHRSFSLERTVVGKVVQISTCEAGTWRPWSVGLLVGLLVG